MRHYLRLNTFLMWSAWGNICCLILTHPSNLSRFRNSPKLPCNSLNNNWETPLFDFDDDITPAEARLAYDYVFGFLG